MSKINAKIGDAAAINGNIRVSERNIIHERSKTSADKARDKNTLFVNACKRAYSDSILTKEEEAELELYREELGLDAATASEIKDSVKQMASNARFTTRLKPAAKIICKQFKDAIKSNNISKLKDMLDGVQSLTEKNANEELHFMFYLVAAALDPQRCAKLYDERKSDDNYWQAFWSYLALINLGRKDDAEELLMNIPNVYADYPEDNATVLAAVGIMMEEGKESVQTYLNEIQGEYSPLLQNFVDSLYQMSSPSYAAESGFEASECDFYLQRVLFIKGVSSGNKDIDAKREYNRIVEDARKDSRIDYNEDCTILIKCTDEDIEEFNVPSCVQHISGNAFGDCPNLKRITLPEGLLSIDEYAFIETSIEEIVIPNSVNEIGQCVFMDCTSLKKVQLPKDITKIPEGAFMGTDIDEITLPKNVKSIEKASFADCQSLEEVILNDGLQSIGEIAFDGSAMHTIKFPKTLKKIGRKAFTESELEEINFPVGLESIGESAFAGCSNLTKATVPGGIKSFGEDIFAESALEEVDLKPGITRIPVGMFRATCIENIDIPDGVEVICEKAFDSCKQLTCVNIPTSILTIEKDAFHGVSDECSVHLNNTDNLSNLNLEGIDFIGSVYVPKGYGAKYLELPIFEDSACNLFEEGCDVIVEVMLRNQESQKKSDQPAELDIEFSDDKKEIIMFNEMDIEEYTIPEGVTTIYPGAFCGCKKLKSLILPSTLTSIGKTAFEGSGIESMVIPSNVSIIKKDAFHACKQLKTLEFKSSKLDNVKYEGLPDNPEVKIIVPQGSLKVYKSHPSFAKFKSITETKSGNDDDPSIDVKNNDQQVKADKAKKDEERRRKEAEDKRRREQEERKAKAKRDADAIAAKKAQDEAEKAKAEAEKLKAQTEAKKTRIAAENAKREEAHRQKDKTASSSGKWAVGCLVIIALCVFGITKCACSSSDDSTESSTELVAPEVSNDSEDTNEEDSEDVNNGEIKKNFESFYQTISSWGTPSEYVNNCGNITQDNYLSFKDDAYKKYEDVKDGAYDKYDNIKDKAYDTYDKVKDVAYDKYEKIKDEAYEKYQAQEIEYEEYNEIQSKAYDEYNSAQSKAYDEYNSAQSAAYDEYNEIQSKAYDWYNEVQSLLYDKAYSY